MPCYIYKYSDLIKILIFLLKAKYQIKCSERRILPLRLQYQAGYSNIRRNILQPDILIAPTGISTRSTAAMIIMENNVVRNKGDRHFCELSVTPSRILSRVPVEHFHSFENTEE